MGLRAYKYPKFFRRNYMKKCFVILAILMVTASLAFARGNEQSGSAASTPVEITIYYGDNSTLPFREDWLGVQRAQQLANARVHWEVIPQGEVLTKVNLALNTGIDSPDLMLWQTTASAERSGQAQNGAIVPIGDHSSWTPNFNARVAEHNLQADIDLLKIGGKLYYLPAVRDLPFYDAGLILREDILARYNVPAPKTYDDLYRILSRYKQENPSSYPMTTYLGPRVHYMFTMPAWGVSLHRLNDGGSRILSWDYSRNQYFAGIISDQYREYLRFWNKLYSEGLFDPEMVDPIPGDVWTRKMATGASIATHAWYDQIGGIAAASTIPGFKLNMYPPVAGPAGAYTTAKNRTDGGMLFPISVSRRPDFERVVRAVDQMFYSKEAELLWCLGVEGTTYTMQGSTIRYADSIVNSADGIYKTMQLRYGLGAAQLQYVWVNAREMTKYDENYSQLNKAVAAMTPNPMRPLPPTLKYPANSTTDSDRAAILSGILYDAWLVWDDNFITGRRSVETDWNAYVADMRSKGIDEFVAIYNKYK